MKIMVVMGEYPPEENERRRQAVLNCSSPGTDIGFAVIKATFLRRSNSQVNSLSAGPLVAEVAGKFTASFFCSTDTESNQIASFYTGAMAHAGELSFRGVDGCQLAIISPNDPEAMVQYAEECRTLGIPFIWDPGQQCARMSGPELQDGFEGSALVICNDYEFELIRQKTSIDEDSVLEHTQALVITRGENGSSIYTPAGRRDVPAVPPTRIVDPTGVGDAFRAGYMRGMTLRSGRVDHEVCARMGAVAATYALEHLGGQSHAFTVAEFNARYKSNFGANFSGSVLGFQHS
jgi:adenosine kinase